jgi:lipid A 3-O-deacylase
MEKKKLRINMRFAVSLAFAIAAAGAHADGQSATAFVAEGGVTVHGTYSLTAGIAVPSTWHRISHNGEWTAYTELFVSHWRAKFDGRHASFTQFGVMPVLRYRFDHGGSPWFAEGGVGLSYLDGLYRRDQKRFSTRFNFNDVLGVGRSFGARREQEVSLRFVHVSNAGIKEPNPGENFVQLRYARAF